MRYEKLDRLAGGSPPPTGAIKIPADQNYLGLDTGEGVYKGYPFKIPIDVLSTLLTQVKMAVVEHVEAKIDAEDRAVEDFPS